MTISFTSKFENQVKDLTKLTNGKLLVRILRLGKMQYEDKTSAEWFDFVEVPQGYIHVCGTSVRKPKRTRKFPHTNGSLIDPTDDQIIEQAKSYLAQNLNPNDFQFEITDQDFRKNGADRK